MGLDEEGEFPSEVQVLSVGASLGVENAVAQALLFGL